MADADPSPADELRDPFTDQTIRFLSEDDEVLVMESSYCAGVLQAAADPEAEGAAEAAKFDVADYADIFRIA